VGDRTGLFARLAGQGPLTLEQIVKRSALNERYLREVLAALAAAEIVRYDPERKTYELPEAAAACLSDERSPYFLGGWTQIIPSILQAVPEVARAARDGGGVPYSAFGEEMVAGIDRSNSPGTRVLLTRRWLRSLPDVVKQLEEGVRVADVGCGSGAASIALGKAFPRARVTGFDLDATSVERARRGALAERLENVSFEQVAAQALPTEPPFDFIMSFDTIHDMAKPREALRRIRQALAAEGTYLMVEPAAGDTLEENLHPGGALLYAMSTLHCMTVSLAHGGEGLGAAWGPRLAEELCREAGFTRFRRLDVDNPFNAFYEVRP
jgi:2-polyprenyl-3-methyl-5-hydroxy-6-metoxy-1,4-benzoquinol methylase